MDRVTRAYYELAFKVNFMEKNGNAFQDFFCDIMERCHPNDFIRVRPWGNIGDRKNDGYLSSERTLFQVFAPKDMKDAQTTSKIKADFIGALPYWQQYFDDWIFAHNSRDGLSPNVTQTLLGLRQQYSHPHIGTWGFAELRARAFRLDEVDVASILGPAFSSRDILNLRFEDLEAALKGIAEIQPPSNPDLRPVPPDKLSENDLSDDTRILLTAGMTKADLVGTYFANIPDKETGDRIAEAFKVQYRTLRTSGLDQNSVFQELFDYAGGNQGTVGRKVAALAILAYLFEQCEIFERPTTESLP